jgi:hypothetical protein
MKSLFTEKEVKFIGDLAYDFKFLDYCQDDDELNIMKSIEHAAYSCTSVYSYLRDNSKEYKDFGNLVTVNQLQLLRRCLEEKNSDTRVAGPQFDASDLHKQVYLKICSVTTTSLPRFSKEEFIKLYKEVQELKARLEKL